MLFSSPNKILVLNIKSLDFYFSGQQQTWTFPPETSDGLELKEPEKLNQSLLEFLQANNVPKCKAVLVLSDEVVFKKEIAEKDPAKISSAVDQLLTEIPGGQDKINYQILKNNDNLYIIGVNKNLYLPLIKTLKSYGLQITKVIPLTATWFGRIDQNTAKEFLENIKKLESTDFLSHHVASEKLKNKAVRKNGFNFPLFFLTILLSAAITGSAIYLASGNIGNRTSDKKPAVEVVITKTPKPTITPAKTEPKEKAVIDKKEIKIQVLNGNGGDGVASGAKAILDKAGYGNVETGNAGIYDYENTLIQVKEKSEELYVLLRKDLENNYEIKKNSEILESDSPFDAIIIIGQK